MNSGRISFAAASNTNLKIRQILYYLYQISVLLAMGIFCSFAIALVRIFSRLIKLIFIAYASFFILFWCFLSLLFTPLLYHFIFQAWNINVQIECVTKRKKQLTKWAALMAMIKISVAGLLAAPLLHRRIIIFDFWAF